MYRFKTILDRPTSHTNTEKPENKESVEVSIALSIPNSSPSFGSDLFNLFVLILCELKERQKAVSV